MNIHMYCARRIKDGNEVKGYPAISGDGTCAWIMVPVPGTDNQFHSVHVDGDSISSCKTDE